MECWSDEWKARVMDGGDDMPKDSCILESVRAFISRYESRFQRGEAGQIPNDRAGFRDEGIYWFFPSALKEASGGYSAHKAAQALDRAGWIVDRNYPRLTKKARKGGKPKNFYVIQPSGRRRVTSCEDPFDELRELLSIDAFIVDDSVQGDREMRERYRLGIESFLAGHHMDFE